MNRIFTIAALAAATFASSACVVTTDSPPAGRTVVVEPTDPAGSTLVVQWTIGGLAIPAECVKEPRLGAVEVTITDTAGAVLGAYEQGCSAFAMSIPLTPGTYAASAVLHDEAGAPATTAVPIAPFTLAENDSLTVPIDFPLDSFFRLFP